MNNDETTEQRSGFMILDFWKKLRRSGREEVHFTRLEFRLLRRKMVQSLVTSAATFWVGGMAFAATNDLSGLLQRGLFEEEANHNLEAAAQAYQSAAVQFDKDRKLAATAVFRLGEVYRKQGKTNEANAQYERVLREFSDQKTLADLSRQNLPRQNVYDNRLAGVVQRGTNVSGTITTSEEAEEIRRIQALIKNSPDLINAATVPLTQGGDNPVVGAPLHKAAKLGQLTVAKFLLENGAQVNSRSSRGETALFLAASAGHLAMVELLLAHGADPAIATSTRVTSGNTPLHEAADKGFRAVAESLLKHGALVNVTNTQGETPLHKAAVKGNAAIIELLVSNNADVSAKTRKGGTPLFYAIGGNKLDIARLLISKGANVNARAEDETTPLWTAVQGEKFDMARLLLENGADVNAATSDNFNKDGVTSLHEAVKGDELPMAELLLKSGANPNSKVNFSNQKPSYISSSTYESVTPLMIATLKDSPEMVNLLLKYKADPNERNKSGLTPLHYATLPKIAESLLPGGADINAKTDKGFTPLHLAVDRKDKAMVAFLLSKGAGPNTKAEFGNTPLHQAVSEQLKTIAELLLKAKADNEQGKTPLDIVNANLTQSVGSIRSLPTLTLRMPGKTGIDSGEIGTWKEMGELLIKYGADEFRSRRKEIAATRFDLPRFIIFSKGTNAVSHFTFLELIAETYSHDMLRNPNGSFQMVSQSLKFPDFARIKIHRLEGGSEKIVPVDVSAAFETGDCSKDVWLQWGDVVEIPEADHPVNESWVWLDYRKGNLTKCLRRKISISVKGESKSFFLEPSLSGATRITNPLGVSATNQPSERVLHTFWAGNAIRISGMLLTSSDLTRVTIKHVDPITRETTNLVLNFQNTTTANDLWLRDGDIIEIPERSE